MAEIQSKRPLPAGWVWTTLGEACHSPQYGWTTRATKKGSLRLLRTTDITSGSVNWESVPFCQKEPTDKTKYLLHDGDIVISRAGSVGYSYLVKKPKSAVFASYLIRFKPLIDEQYTAYFLQSPSYWESVYEERLGIAIPNINATKLKKIALPLAPLPEQRRIVAEIETQFTRLDAGVAALERAQANLRRYKASVLKAACEGQLVPTEAELARAENRAYEPAGQLLARILAERRARWEVEHPSKKYKEPSPPDTENLPELPEGWVWASVGQLADHRLGKMLDKTKNRGTPRPYLRNFNVRWFGFDLTDIKYMRVTKEELDNVSVHEGDLIVCEGGEPGRAAVWDKPGKSMAIQKALHRVRPAADVSPWYLAYRLAADASTGILEKYFTGSTIKHFTGRSLHSYVFPLPPTAEQHRIVAEVERRLSVVAALEASVETSLARARRLRQSILKRAFEGQLVPQDPDDEPATVLLERIRARR